MKVLNLKEYPNLIPQYVELRNKYKELLLTNNVDIDGTKKWLKNNDLEVVCLVENNILEGVGILYNTGEIAYFVRTPKQGIGTKILQLIEDIAKNKGLNQIWATVLKENIIAQKPFLKNGFFYEGELSKIYNNKEVCVLKYVKKINNN